MKRKNFQWKKKIFISGGLETFLADLTIFWEIRWKKRPPNRRNIDFQQILISSRSDSQKYFCWIFERALNRRNINFKCNVKSARNAWFLVHFQWTEQGLNIAYTVINRIKGYKTSIPRPSNVTCPPCSTRQNVAMLGTHATGSISIPLL